MRGPRTRLSHDRLLELSALLEGPTIELGGPTAARCTPDELVHSMTADIQRVQAQVAAITGVWDDLVGPVGAARAQLATVLKLAASLGSGHDAELQRLQHRVDVLAEIVMSDPLAVDRDELDDVTRGIDALGRELVRAVDLRASAERRLAGAKALLAEVQSVAAAAQQAHRTVVEKIQMPSSSAAPDAQPDALAADLRGVEEHARHGDWVGADHALATWTDRARAELRTVEAELAARRAPIDERNGLRGRLEAYRAKAAVVGLLEHERAASLYLQARTALYTAPTDLVAATELVAGTASPSPTRREECRGVCDHGTLDGRYCTVCGVRPSGTPAAAATSGRTPTTATSSTPTTGTRTRSRVGGGLVEVALSAVVDPATVLLDEPGSPRSGASAGRATTPSVANGGRVAGPDRRVMPPVRRPFTFEPKLGPGDVVGGQYEVARHLAHGGLGWIYLARDRRVELKWVVLKGMLDTDDEEATAAAVAEAVPRPGRASKHRPHPQLRRARRRRLHRHGIRRRHQPAAEQQDRREANGGQPAPLPVAEAIGYVLDCLPALGYCMTSAWRTATSSPTT